MKIKFLFFILNFLLPIYCMAITVKINNPRLDVDANNNSGDPVISVHCTLNVSGIEGKDFDLVAIVMDENGDWHKDNEGNTVKTHYKCIATYDNSTWKDIEVWLKHSNLSPKQGKHSYKVYLYVYYNEEWYGRTYAGSYNMTGNSSNSHSTHTHNSSNQNSESYNSIKCTNCGGTGSHTCWGCGGQGGIWSSEFNFYTYKSYPVFRTCVACNGKGTVTCAICCGIGYIYIPQYNPNNSNSTYSPIYSSPNYNNMNSNSSNHNSSTYTTCTSCGGTGVCRWCNGTKGKWEDVGYYTGRDVKSFINCGSCNGSGKCPICYGRGKL